MHLFEKATTCLKWPVLVLPSVTQPFFEKTLIQTSSYGPEINFSFPICKKMHLFEKATTHLKWSVLALPSITQMFFEKNHSKVVQGLDFFE